MSREQSPDQILSDMGKCKLTKARSHARNLTRLYDKYLSPYDIRSTELSVLAVTGKLESARLHEIAEKLSMDLSSLSRTIGLLEKKGWIKIEKQGHRTRRASLTKKGVKKLQDSYTGWKKAQQEV